MIQAEHLLMLVIPQFKTDCHLLVCQYVFCGIGQVSLLTFDADIVARRTCLIGNLAL